VGIEEDEISLFGFVSWSVAIATGSDREREREREKRVLVF